MSAQPGSELISLKQVGAESLWKGMWRLLEGRRLAYVGSMLGLGIAALGRSSVYLLLGFFIDDVLSSPDFAAQVPLVALGFIGLAVVQGFFTYLSGTLAGRTGEVVAERLRNYLYDHIQRLSFNFHDRTKTGELIQKVTSDVDAVRRFIAQEATQFGRIVTLFLANFAALFLLDGQLAWLSVICVPITILMSIWFFKRISDAYEEFQNQDGVLSAVLQENLSGVRVVKAFARQEYEQNKFEKENQEKYVRGRKLLIWHSAFWPLSDIITGAQMLFGYYIGAQMTISGQLSTGDYLSYITLLVWLIWPIRNLGRVIVEMSRGLVSFERVSRIIREEREPLEDGQASLPERLKGEIAFENVSFEYEPNMPVLKNISFHVQPGQTVALLGSTGSGKTSLVSLLPRFYDYTSGRILLDGVELKDYPRRYLREQIGIVLQEPFLFSRTIRENLRYSVGREVDNADIEAAAADAAVHDVVLGFPKGYETIVGEKGVTLSGGQKQRITLARTLLKKPSLLILDDSTSAVDTETEASIRAALKRQLGGRTTFIIAHRIQSVMSADLILVFDKGRLVQQGTHAQLLEQDGIYREVFNIQTMIEHEVEREVASANQGQ
ncbi:MAG: ABC transporter ATP-binding protein [Anaerolineales bacterium]|nr:ABC transporter ATP-binding protein [Anaerolineales bacterium]MCW5854692.1 ABC transporter ATP-binding protein [Anaerolineales bacterium]